MRFKKTGFTLMELMVSIAILTLISGSTIFALQRSREKEELNIVARMLASDIKNIQARGLAARNILTCNVGSGKRVCEPENKSLLVCDDACQLLPPPKFGVWISTRSGAYILFADVNLEDWRYSNPEEMLMERSFDRIGEGKVVLSSIQSENGNLDSVSLAVARQNGMMRINACGAELVPCEPTEPQQVTLTLRHTKSNDMISVEINALTGRVSILN